MKKAEQNQKIGHNKKLGKIEKKKKKKLDQIAKFFFFKKRKEKTGQK